MLSLTSGTELRRFGRGRLPRLAVAAMLLVPLLYGALYLWAFWDPTGHLDAMPVALVNADAGADRDGARVTAGQDLTDELVDGAALDWVVTDATDAAAGVRDGDYYFAVTIPADFSADLVSAGGETPTAAQIDVTYNDATSFIGTTLGRSAMDHVRDGVAATAGEQAVDQVLVGLGSARDGMVQAADGAVSLHDASQQLGEGAQRVADGAIDAEDGAARLAAGASTLDGGVRDVAAGADRLSSGATQLSAGARSAADASGPLASGAQSVADGVHAATQQVDALTGRLPALTDGLTQVSAYLSARAAAGDPDAAALLAGLAGADLPDAATLSAMTEQLHALDSGAAQAAAGAQTLSTGLGTLADSSVSVASGASDLASGARQAAAGADTLATGSAALASGTVTLADGATQVADGTGRLGDGAQQLADGLSDGATQIPDDSAAQRTARAGALSTPVAIDDEDVAPAASLGEGFAPLFIPLALFVGGLITWLLLRPLPTRALATPASGWRVALAGYLPSLVIGAGQVVLLLGVVGLGLGLHIGHPVGTVAFLLLVAACFLALQQMLLSVLGSAAGKVATIALLMLQITSASGTYPVETTPAFFQAIHHVLPMTYAVGGLRSLITGAPDARLWTAVVYLVAVAFASLAVTAWKAGRLRTWTVARLHPALSI
ncbi:YhgE/Pip domain-containing protein [Cellulomonas xylanilytica]|uniref:Membrane protein n=1 Tax=Cellulomonas xylanilytica TaxID=233583 RepID=A0A510UY61_9CELL|nr:YhgE/Pip domain-containing protein [Cellulomonas xylanilytica]GEK19608.1 membrane protein [Cellulomonas xylanilytica]